MQFNDTQHNGLFGSSRAPFVWPVRVYYEDTDSGGVVYYANYLKFMERARSEWLRAHGFDPVALVQEHHLMFAVVRLTVEYRRPARLGDLLEVGVKLLASRRASIEFLQDVTHASPGPGLLCRAHVKIACVDAVTLRPRSIPSFIASELALER